MNQNSVKTIDCKDESRKDSYLFYVKQADGLKVTLTRILMNSRTLIVGIVFQLNNGFFWALEVNRVIKIDIKCDCCEYNILFQMILRTLKKKNALVKKVLI